MDLSVQSAEALGCSHNSTADRGQVSDGVLLCLYGSLGNDLAERSLTVAAPMCFQIRDRNITVLLCIVFFAGREDCSAAQVRRTPEHSPVRQHWEPRAGRVSPGTGRKNPGPRASFALRALWGVHGLRRAACGAGGYLLTVPSTPPGSLCGFRSFGTKGLGTTLPSGTTKKKPSLKPPP